MKHATLLLLRMVGGFSLFRVANRNRALILTYHRFGDRPFATSARTLDEQLKCLTTRYSVVPLEKIVERVAAGQPLPPGAAAITIDDGYDDAYRVAFPLFLRYRVPATLFVVTDFLHGRAWVWTDKMRYIASRAAAGEWRASIGAREWRVTLSDTASRLDAATRLNTELKRLGDEEKDDQIARLAASAGVDVPALPPREFAPITWDEAREMSAGGVSIGSHTVTHPILTHCTDERLRTELTEARACIEAELGRPCRVFCYPDGSVDQRVRDAVERAGYAGAVTMAHALTRRDADPFALPRVHTEADYTHFLQSTSGFEELKHAVRRAGKRRMTAPVRPERPALP